MFSSLKKGDDFDDIVPKKLKKMKPVTVIPEPNTEFYKNNFGDFPRLKLSLSTDKDTYKPSETVYIRGIILDAFDHRPFSSKYPNLLDKIGQLHVKILSPKDEEIKNMQIMQEESVVAFDWNLEEEIPGGTYTIEVYTTMGKGLCPSIKKISINKYNPPRFKKTLDFLQKGYSAGDSVKATLKVERSEGGFPDSEKCTLVASARLDGREFFRTSEIKLNAIGKCEFQFDLPEIIEKGVGSLNVSISEGLTENVSKTLPIILKVLDCHVYPEGGDLFVGCKNGVYVEAFTPALDPADFEADLEEVDSGEFVCKVKTLHEGRAYFEFIPRKGVDYQLRVTKPSGITKPHKLPKALEKGIGLFVQNKEKLEFEKSINVQVFDPEQKSKIVYIGLFKREKEIDVQKIELNGISNVSLNPFKVDGVLRILVTDEKFQPKSERLVFIPPKESISFEIISDKNVYAPGDHVELTIKTSHPARLCVTVTDDSVYKMKEKRERSARLPAQQFFENEVKELYDSDSYLVFDEDEKEIKIPPGVKRDLLLGTQGWRRFAMTRIQEFMNESVDVQKTKMLMNIEYDQNLIERERTEMFFEEDKEGGMVLEEIVKKEQKIVIMDDKKEDKDFKEPKEPEKPEKPEIAMAEIKNMKIDLPDEENEKKKEEEEEEEEEEEWDEEDEGEIHFDLEPIILEYRRVYAFKVRSGRIVGEREDFTETLFFESYRRVEKEEEMKVEFDLNDAVSTFCVFIDAFTDDGIMGFENKYLIQSLSPFFIEPKMPLELTFGDHFFLPVSINSNMQMELNSNVRIDSTPGIIIQNNQINQLLKPLDRIGKYIEMKAESGQKEKEEEEENGSDGSCEVSIKITGRVENIPTLQDNITKKCKLYPFGFPASFDFSGKIEENEKNKTFLFEMAKEIVNGSMTTKTCVYPGPLSSIMDGVDSLIREPGGCFEQTSMTMYPMILAIQYMNTNPEKIDEELFKKANRFLDSGYKRLLSYECKTGGFEWFGSDPGHEALSSMGLLEFMDLKKIYPVDEAMIKRTSDWLISRLKEDKTGFRRNPRALDYFGGAPEDVTDSYIIYALSRSKIIPYEKLSCCLEKLEKDCEIKDDSYFISLVALSLFNFGKKERSRRIVKNILMGGERGFHLASGLVERSSTSITSSSGVDLQVQTTSLAIINLLNFKDEYLDQAETSINFLLSKNRGGRFGSTQATVLALEALVAFALSTACVEVGGSVILEVNGNKLPKKDFEKGNEDSIIIDDFSHLIIPGKENEISLSMIEGCKMPFSIQLSYFSPKPVESKKKKILYFQAVLKDEVVNEGDLTEIEIKLENLDQKKAKGMTCIVINIPSGLVTRIKKLEELKKNGVIDHFELLGSRKIVIYFRQLLAGEKKGFLIDVSGDIPGQFTAMASYAYLYYDDLHKSYFDGLRVKVLKKK